MAKAISGHSAHKRAMAMAIPEAPPLVSDDVRDCGHVTASLATVASKQMQTMT
jgi:hypothetical protein